MIGLYFGGEEFRTLFGSDFGNLELDANLEESHEWKADATSSPVEDGAPITDHIIEQADVLRVRGLLTETPIMAGFTPSGDSRTQSAFDLLRKMIKARQTMTVYTLYRTYPDMALVSLDIPRTPDVGEAVEFTAEFRHIRKVATQIVDVPPGISSKKSARAGTAAKKAEPAKDAGKKQPEEVNQSRARAIASKLSEMLN
jgi:hypothetical protein